MDTFMILYGVTCFLFGAVATIIGVSVYVAHPISKRISNKPSTPKPTNLPSRPKPPATQQITEGAKPKPKPDNG